MVALFAERDQPRPCRLHVLKSGERGHGGVELSLGAFELALRVLRAVLDPGGAANTFERVLNGFDNDAFGEIGRHGDPAGTVADG